MEEIIRSISDVLDKNEVMHVIIGGIAVLAWGKPRATLDVDIVTLLSLNNLENVVKDLSTSGFSIPKDALNRLQRGLPVKFRHGIYSVDLRLASFSLDKQAIQRARIIKGLAIASKEDLIVYKLARFDNQDKADIETVLDRQRKIDFEYIEAAAKQLAVEARRPQVLTNFAEMMTWRKN